MLVPQEVLRAFCPEVGIRRAEIAMCRPLPTRPVVMERYGVSRATAKRDLAAVRRFLAVEAAE